MLKTSPAYSHLASVTNEAEMQSIFQTQLTRFWGRPVAMENYHIPRVIPKGEGKFLVQYRFSTVDKHGSQPRIFFGRLLSPAEMIPAYAKEPNAFFVSDIRLVVPIFPFDPKLKMLAQFFDPAFGPHLLQPLGQAVGLNGTAHMAKVEVLGYRLERRGTLSVSVQERTRTVSLVAKLVRSEKATGLFDQLQALEKNGFGETSEGNLRVPHPLAVTPDGVLWLEAVFDLSLHDLIGTEPYVSACRSAGLVLQRLHSANLSNLPTFTVEEAQAQLKTLALETAQIYPVLREGIEGVWSHLKTDAPVLAEKDFVPVHRDFYDKQLLVGANRITLLDTDTLSLGDPALDIGNFLAHLILRGKQHLLPEETLAQTKKDFLETYNSKKSSVMEKDFEKRVKWWKAAALLRLACLYSLRPRWKKLAWPLLEQSEKALQGEKYA
jgi:hypothetical protein